MAAGLRCLPYYGIKQEIIFSILCKYLKMNILTRRSKIYNSCLIKYTKQDIVRNFKKTINQE